MVGWLAQEGGTIEAVFGSSEKAALWVILGISIVALLFAWYLVREVLSAPEGTPKMREIALAIQEGAKAYLSRQFRTVAVFLAVLAVALFFVLPAPANAEHSAFSIKFGRSIAFILGASFSAITGYVGMWLAVRANVRTANAARESGLRKAMRCWSDSGSAAPCSRCSCVSAAASSPRRPTSAPTWSARSSKASPRTIRATQR
jgi:K(+)-stimulated pyrophosphate-energized sodium pump